MTGAWLMVSGGNGDPPRYWMASEERPTECDGMRHVVLAFEPGEYGEAAVRLAERLRGVPGWEHVIAGVERDQEWLAAVVQT